METITIRKGSTEVTLPKVKGIIISADEVSKKTIMASGKIVKDVIGTRPTIYGKWDYIPAGVMVELMRLLRGGGFFEVEYPDPSGPASGIFEIEIPSPGVFQYVNSIPVWHNITLKMMSQEVT